MDWIIIFIKIAGAVFLMLTSGKVINFFLSKIARKGNAPEVDKLTRDTGFLVGKCENILIFIFVLVEEYTAFALIFAAKAIVRKEDIQQNTLFFLAGTMVNVTYSILISLVFKYAANHIPHYF